MTATPSGLLIIGRFLDEVGELPLAIQAKLLRVLEARVLQRIGDVKPRAVDELERDRMVAALAATGGVQNKAAELIGMPVRTFVTKLRRYAIGAAEWK